MTHFFFLFFKMFNDTSVLAVDIGNNDLKS